MRRLQAEAGMPRQRPLDVTTTNQPTPAASVYLFLSDDPAAPRFTKANRQRQNPLPRFDERSPNDHSWDLNKSVPS